MPPYSAYLRVYEPLAAFREPALAAWAMYSDPESSLPDPREVLADELDRVRRGLASTPPVLVPERESDQALVRRIDETTYICPLETRSRSVLAYTTLDAGLPTEVVEAAVPAESRAVADRRVERTGTEVVQRRHIRDARWHVPLSWFVLFRSDERRLVLVPGEAAEQAAEDAGTVPAPDATGDTGPDRTMSYLTRMPDARKRLARALAVLRKTVEGTIIEEVEGLGRWLEEFHPHALVELDYGGIVELVDDGFLLTDRSVDDVAEGLAALAAGDAEGAAGHYQAIVARWVTVERHETAN